MNKETQIDILLGKTDRGRRGVGGTTTKTIQNKLFMSLIAQAFHKWLPLLFSFPSS